MLRWFINYIRSCFCRHDWEQIFESRVVGEDEEYRCKVYRCRKCGYSRKYKSH